MCVALIRVFLERRKLLHVVEQHQRPVEENTSSPSRPVTVLVVPMLLNI